MKHKIIEMDEILVAGIEVRTINGHGQAEVVIGQTWQSFFDKGIPFKMQNRANEKMIGLYSEYAGDYTKAYTFLCGCQVTTDETTMKVKRIPAGKYAKFTVHGDPTKVLQEVWQYVWQSDLERVYTSDFEEYHNDRDSEGKQTVDVFIAIK